ncbi:MAG: DUF4386 family protein [Solirubrobacterales bacterium]|nr:DUF4386 family protein [Solirubrobacterales bacterium]
MSVSEQLAWESRWAKPAAASAFLSVILTVAASIYVSSSVDAQPGADETDALLALVDAQSGVFITGAVISAAGKLFLIGLLWYLYRAARFRRPDLNPAALIVAILGPVLLAVADVLGQLNLVDKAGDFVATAGDFANQEAADEAADEVVADRPAVLQSLGLGGALALAFGTVMISQAAMRAGLLTRFLGILGIVVGVLYVLGTLFPLGTDLIRLFWLIAVGLIVLGWWPGGRGPAWASGKEDPWLSAAQRYALEQQAEQEAKGSANGGGDGDEPTRSRSSRKRKRR